MHISAVAEINKNHPDPLGTFIGAVWTTTYLPHHLLLLYSPYALLARHVTEGLPTSQCFQVGCALSPNTASILVFRFLGGLFAAAPLTNSG
jgi:hypothetical protein